MIGVFATLTAQTGLQHAGRLIYLSKIMRVFPMIFTREGWLKMLKKMVLILTAALMIAGLAGCSKEGPAEKAGKKLDEAAQKAKKMFD